MFYLQFCCDCDAGGGRGPLLDTQHLSDCLPELEVQGWHMGYEFTRITTWYSGEKSNENAEWRKAQHRWYICTYDSYVHIIWVDMSHVSLPGWTWCNRGRNLLRCCRERAGPSPFCVEIQFKISIVKLRYNFADNLSQGVVAKKWKFKKKIKNFSQGIVAKK